MRAVKIRDGGLRDVDFCEVLGHSVSGSRTEVEANAATKETRAREGLGRQGCACVLLLHRAKKVW